MKHQADNSEDTSVRTLLTWIMGGVLGLGLPALSILFTHSFLIHIQKLGTLIQRTGHPFLALLPGILVALLCLREAVMASSRKTLMQLIGVGGIVASVVALWIQVLVIRQDFPIKQIPFVAEEWRDAGCDTSRSRQMMVAGLVDQIRGMTPQQVTALLGPTEVGESSYCIGPEAVAVPTDRLVLRVLYDAHGKAVDVRISAN